MLPTRPENAHTLHVLPALILATMGDLFFILTLQMRESIFRKATRSNGRTKPGPRTFYLVLQPVRLALYVVEGLSGMNTNTHTPQM